MSNDGFKDFIKNLTAADIMNDYGEQRDEWETLLSVKDGVRLQIISLKKHVTHLHCRREAMQK